MDTKELTELLERALKGFKFQYEGGGHFRDKTVPRGERAETVHGEEVLKAFCKSVVSLVQDGRD